MDYYDYNYPKNLFRDYFKYPDNNRRRRSLAKSAPSISHAVNAEDMSHMAGEDVKMNGRVKRDLGQDLRYLFNDYDYQPMPKRAVEYPYYDENDSDYDINPEDMPQQLSNDDLEALIKAEITELQDEREAEEEAYEPPYEREQYRGYPYGLEEEEEYDGVARLPEQRSLYQEYLSEPDSDEQSLDKRAGEEENGLSQEVWTPYPLIIIRYQIYAMVGSMVT